jgi:hypothetical protein
VVEPSTMSTLFSVISLRVLLTALVCPTRRRARCS